MNPVMTAPADSLNSSIANSGLQPANYSDRGGTPVEGHQPITAYNGLQTTSANEVSSPLSQNSADGSIIQQPPISIILTVRLLMQGKEVGSIIGKRGDHVKLIRESSGAKVNISDGSCPERIVTITGSASAVNKAFAMISKKFEEDLQSLPNSVPKPPITMRLVVPATQCGSLIGKGGSKIKEIREKTGASIQVATEMLPNSTERAVTISGTCEALIDCMQEVCQILLEAPAKAGTLAFRPKPSYNPLLIASSAAAAAAAQQQATQHISSAALLQQLQQQQQQQSAANNPNALQTITQPQLTALAAYQQELAKLQPAIVDPLSSSLSSTNPLFPGGYQSTTTPFATGAPTSSATSNMLLNPNQANGLGAQTLAMAAQPLQAIGQLLQQNPSIAYSLLGGLGAATAPQPNYDGAISPNLAFLQQLQQMQQQQQQLLSAQTQQQWQELLAIGGSIENQHQHLTLVQQMPGLGVSGGAQNHLSALDPTAPRTKGSHGHNLTGGVAGHGNLSGGGTATSKFRFSPY